MPSFLKNYVVEIFKYPFQEHQKCVFKVSRKTENAIFSFGGALTLTISIWSLHFKRHVSGLRKILYREYSDIIIKTALGLGHSVSEGDISEIQIKTK